MKGEVNMKRLLMTLIALTLLSSYGFATGMDTLELKGVQTVDEVADLAQETIVTLRNADKSVSTSVTVRSLSNKYSIHLLDSSTNTLNARLQLSKRAKDGMYKHLICTDYSKPISITTNILITAGNTANATSVYAKSVLAVTENITFTAAGQSASFIYSKPLSKWLRLGSITTTNINAN